MRFRFFQVLERYEVILVGPAVAVSPVGQTALDHGAVSLSNEFIALVHVLPSFSEHGDASAAFPFALANFDIDADMPIEPAANSPHRQSMRSNMSEEGSDYRNPPETRRSGLNRNCHPFTWHTALLFPL